MGFISKKIGKLFGRSSKNAETDGPTKTFNNPAGGANNGKVSKKLKRKELKERRKKDANRATSFPSSPHSAEIRIQKIAQPSPSSHGGSVTLQPPPVKHVTALGENQQYRNEPNVMHRDGSRNGVGVTGGGGAVGGSGIPSALAQKSPSANNVQRQFLYQNSQKSPKKGYHPAGGSGGGGTTGFGSSDDDDSENHLNYPGANGMHPHSQPFEQQNQMLSFGFQNHHHHGGGPAIPPQVQPNAMYLSQTPASSSEFCLSTDVEDDEYNRMKHMGVEQSVLNVKSDSTEEDSALFPGLPQKTFSEENEDFFNSAGNGNNNVGGLLPRTGLSSEEEERAWSPSRGGGSPSPAKQQQQEGGRAGLSPTMSGSPHHNHLGNRQNSSSPVSKLDLPNQQAHSRHGSSFKNGDSAPTIKTKLAPGVKPGAGLYPDSSDSEFDPDEDGEGASFTDGPLAGESCLSSPASAAGNTNERRRREGQAGSPTVSERLAQANSQQHAKNDPQDNGMVSPTGRTVRINETPTRSSLSPRTSPAMSSSPVASSTTASSAAARPKATPFEDFVQGDWPASPTPATAGKGRTTINSGKSSIISFNDLRDSLSSPEKKKQGGSSSIASAPIVDARLGRGSGKYGHTRAGSTRNRSGSRSVAPTSNLPGHSHRRQASDPFSPRGTARMLDKLERDLKEKQSRKESAASSRVESSGSNTESSSGAGPPPPSRADPNHDRAKRRSRRRKEKDNVSPLVAQRRQEGGGGDGDHSSSEEENSFLFDSVADTLGPRGVAADMESLSGRSTRSKTSVGGKSTRSHRSHKSHRSRRGKNRHSSGASVSSRTSHYSTRSHMSEASRSVANDLLRLEMQLAMVGAETSDAPAMAAANGVSTTSGNLVPSSGGSISGYGSRPGYGGGSVSGSVGGASRASRTSRSSRARRKAGSTTGGVSRHASPRSRSTVVAPPGKLGLILANKPDGRGTVVSGVRPTSPLVDKILPGDRIVAVDGEDVSLLTVSELTTIMTRKGEFERTLTVISPLKSSSAPPPAGPASPAPIPLRSPDSHSNGAGISPVANYSYR